MTDAPKFISIDGRPREVQVKLDWPIEYDGKVWDIITVRRVTSAELSAFIESPEGSAFPNIDCPRDLLDHLDAEDGFKIEEMAQSFFPRRSQQKASE